jgi:outer membrane protein assembly factor BamE (lipoprotein component of BamABCDE complex)
MFPQSRFAFFSRSLLVRPATAAVLIALGTASCVINTGSHSDTSGKFIGQQTLDQITPGKSKDFVLAVLGEPTTRTPLSDGTEIWKWIYRQKQKKSGSLLFMFNQDTCTEVESQTFVQFKDEVVNQAWRD